MSRPTPERLVELRKDSQLADGRFVDSRLGEVWAEVDALAARVRELEALAANARDALQRYQQYTATAPIDRHNEYATLMGSIDAVLGSTRRDA